MITPYQHLVELNVSPKANYRCLELSPNGCLVAAITVNSVEIWSFQSNISRLSSFQQSRPSGYSKALLNRLFVLWKSDSKRFVVIRSEGIVDFYEVGFKQKIVEDVYEEAYAPLGCVSATLNKVCSIAIEQFGYPISACTLNDKILIATDSNQIVELNWNGECIGFPLSRFVSSIQYEYTNQKIMSISSCSYLSCLAIALDDNTCLLLDLPSSSHFPITGMIIPSNNQDGIRQVLFCPGLPLLAITSSRLSIDFYQIHKNSIDEKEVVESTEPVESVEPEESTESTQSTTTQPFQAIHHHSIDIRQYPQINSSPLYAYDSIISMCWAPGKPYLVTGLKYQGLMVWSVDGEMLYAYNSISSNTITSQEMNLSQTVEVSCCCFSLDSTRLLFSIPYDEIHQDNQENVITILSHLCYQQFMVTTDIIHSLENCSFFGYTNSSLIHLTNTPSTTLSILPSIYPLPASFIALNEVILGIEISPSGRNALLFTSSSICIFMTSRGKWITAIQFISDGCITACSWLTESIFFLAVASLTSTKPSSTIYAFNLNFLSIREAIQEIDITIPSSTPYQPSVQSLLPSNYPISSFPYIQSIHCYDNSLLCATTTGMFYLFTITAYIEELTVITKQLPIQFNAKGFIHLEFPLRHAFFIQTQQNVLLEDGDTAEVTCQDILCISWNQSVSLYHLTEDAERNTLFPYIQQMILCEHQDRGILQNPMNIDNFIIFITNNQQIAWFPSYERLPSCYYHSNTLIPSQTNSGIWGFSWGKCVLISLLHCGDDIQLTEEKNWIHPIVTCCYHLLIAELLHADQQAVASAFLQLGASIKLPGFINSLEYLLHYALNNEDSSFLANCLQLLSQLPYYSRILVRCLRKQERSLWPFAVQKTEDILQLFHSFLFTGDIEYAVTTISILQGLVCNALPTVSQVSNDIEMLSLEEWKKNIHTQEEWLFEDYGEIFSEQIEKECIAHINGLQLLLICIMKEQYTILPDVYRFLMMEEARHTESHKELNNDYAVNEVLSWVCYMLFKKGHLKAFYNLWKNIEFTWTIDKECMRIDDFSEYFDCILEGCHWKLKRDYIDEHDLLISLPSDDSAITEDEMNELLRCLMKADFAEWSLLLLLILLKSKQLTQFALARGDIWIRCIHDFSVSSNKNVIEYLQSIQYEVEEKRKALV